MVTIRVLGISGSLRKDSYNTQLLYEAARLMPDEMEFERFSLSDIPLYNDDVRMEGYPPAVADLRAKIAAADALLMATPEYNGSISGVLKNALDWVSRPPSPPSDDKPVAILGATTGHYGTSKAQLHLRAVCSSLNMHPINRPKVLISRAQDAFNANGRLIDDAARHYLSDLMQALANWIQRIQI
jgi:chromate reductase